MFAESSEGPVTSHQLGRCRRPSLSECILSGKWAILGVTRMHVPRPARHRLRTHDLRSSHTQANAAPELLLGGHLAGGPQPVSRAVRGMRLGPAPCAVRRPTRGARERAPRGTRRGLTRSPDTTQPSLRVVAVAARPARVPQADKLPGRP